jgi:glycine oxidase
VREDGSYAVPKYIRMNSNTLIVGGGLIGLGIGWQLAKAGVRVTVLERDVAGGSRSGAAGVAAGLLAPLAEAGFDEAAQLALGRASLEMYPEWAAELEADSGLAIDYRSEGTLVAALDRDDAAWLERIHRHQQSLGLPTEWLSGAEAREREPYLTPNVTAGVFSPADHQVDNRRMWEALRVAFERAGGSLRKGAEAVRLEIDERTGRATGAWVRPAGATEGEAERVTAARTIVCAGAWSRLLMAASLPREAVAPIRPVKGQVVVLEMSRLLTLERVVRTRRVYLAPKSDGRLVVGATSEERGFDVQLTAGGVFELLRDAWEAVPGIYDLPLVETRVGLRPASRDHAPLLGETAVPGLYVASGHYRNGVLLTPVTARAMAALLLGRPVPEVVRPFGAQRFQQRIQALTGGMR